MSLNHGVFFSRFVTYFRTHPKLAHYRDVKYDISNIVVFLFIIAHTHKYKQHKKDKVCSCVCVSWCVFHISTKKCDNQKHKIHFENHTSTLRRFPMT